MTSGSKNYVNVNLGLHVSSFTHNGGCVVNGSNVKIVL